MSTAALGSTGTLLSVCLGLSLSLCVSFCLSLCLSQSLYVVQYTLLSLCLAPSLSASLSIIAVSLAECLLLKRNCRACVHPGYMCSATHPAPKGVPDENAGSGPTAAKTPWDISKSNSLSYYLPTPECKLDSDYYKVLSDREYTIAPTQVYTTVDPITSIHHTHYGWWLDPILLLLCGLAALMTGPVVLGAPTPAVLFSSQLPLRYLSPPPHSPVLAVAVPL